MLDNVRMDTARRCILLFMAGALLCMLGASFYQRLSNPHLVVEARAPRGMGGQDIQGGMTDGMSSEVSALMQQVAKDPTDSKAAIHLTEHLVTDQQWDAAETFARRAMTLVPGDAQPRYLLGVILHNKGQHPEAAEALEDVLRMKDEASVRYSLGVLYIYYLKDISKGVQHLSEGLHDPAASEALKKSIREELEKAPLPEPKPTKEKPKK